MKKRSPRFWIIFVSLSIIIATLLFLGTAYLNFLSLDHRSGCDRGWYVLSPDENGVCPGKEKIER